MKCNIIKQSITAHHNNIPISDLNCPTNRLLSSIPPIFLHCELKWEIKTMLLLHKLEDGDQFLVFSDHHQAAIFVMEKVWYLLDSSNGDCCYRGIRPPLLRIRCCRFPIVPVSGLPVAGLYTSRDLPQHTAPLYRIKHKYIRLAQKPRILAGINPLLIPSPNPISNHQQSTRIKKSILTTTVSFLRMWDHVWSMVCKIMKVLVIELKKGLSWD